MIYIDTNIIIDVLDESSQKHEACRTALDNALATGPVFVCDAVYAEASMGMDSMEQLDAVLATLNITRSAPRQSALFTAGRAFLRYKKENEGPKNNVLPDFFIGAQALDENVPLVTSDVKRMAHYFEGLNIVEP